MTDYKVYKVQRSSKQPLLDFMTGALRRSGCRILFVSPADQAPFRITFETPEGERMGVVAYAFFANSKVTNGRPPDEHRLQIKYGNKEYGQEKALHDVWTDPYQVYTTLFLGIDVERGLFVGADPLLHNPTPFFISLEFKRSHVEEILKRGWYSWERAHRARHGGDDNPVEVLVGGTADAFLRYVRFEREAYAEDPGHRQLLAENFGSSARTSPLALPTAAGPVPSAQRVHALASEFEMSESEVLDMIGQARMLKMAVRGWVAEKHLLGQLARVNGVSHCQPAAKDAAGKNPADIQLRYRGRPLRVECKNVLRNTTSDGLVRIDFQKTRTSKADPCSRYYSPQDFEVVAGCLHAVTLKWEFKYALPGRLDFHRGCPGKLSNNVRLDDRWTSEPERVLREAVGTI